MTKKSVGNDIVGLSSQLIGLERELNALRSTQMTEIYRKQNERLIKSLPPYTLTIPRCSGPECLCAAGGGLGNADFTCSLFIEPDPTGTVLNSRISPDNPHMFCRRRKKRRLIWEIDQAAYNAGWTFRDFDPIIVGAEVPEDLPDNSGNNGPKEMTYGYRPGAGNQLRVLVVCFSPLTLIRKQKWVLNYQLALMKNGNAGEPLLLDPIIEYEGE